LPVDFTKKSAGIDEKNPAILIAVFVFLNVSENPRSIWPASSEIIAGIRVRSPDWLSIVLDTTR